MYNLFDLPSNSDVQVDVKPIFHDVSVQCNLLQHSIPLVDASVQCNLQHSVVMSSPTGDSIESELSDGSQVIDTSTETYYPSEENGSS